MVRQINNPGCVSVYSDDEEQDDLLVSLVQQIRKKKPAKSRRRRRSGSEAEESGEEERRGSQSGHRKRRRRKTAVLDKVDKILELKKASKKKKYSEGRMMKKVDKILFSDISSSVSKEERAKARDRFLTEVDDILGLGRKQEEEEEDDESESSDEESEDDDDDLTEGEMRLLNLINHNKIDVKVNFPSEYRGDTDCHFCRKRETSQHLAKCPVYHGVMRGSEFKDLRSSNVKLVKSALENIKLALIKRSEALSVTSLGGISAANMKLLNLSPARERKKTKAEIIDEILATT